MSHVSYDYTVPRALSPVLQAVSPAIKMPHSLHLLQSRHSHQDAIQSNSEDFNATWISLSPDDIREQGGNNGGVAFSSQNYFPSNSTAQDKDWSWKHRAEEEKFGFQVRQVYHTNGAGEEEEMAVSKETDLG